MKTYMKPLAHKTTHRIIKSSLLASLLMTSVLLVGCASQSLKAPCPDYGRHCDKTPINSWDTSTV